MNTEVTNKPQTIFDPIYGFIKLTPVERAIVLSPFYQRLRWIKQLGFAFYVFPGAEHSRFGHSIGALNNADAILRSCALAVPEEKLMNGSKSDSANFHQSLRLAALMHDLGTFPFSHTTESSYIKFGKNNNGGKKKDLKDDHENLGSFVIKNTDYPGGITRILKENDIDPQTISDLVKGVHPSVLANQVLHSEIDCDRMDYLLRDAHYTGLQYGSYDRDYLAYHFRMVMVGGHRVLTIRHNALHCVEDFLASRFAWYSQVIRSPRGARYDAIAERICLFLLEKGLIHSYSDLLDMAAKSPQRFYGFNDSYFMTLVHTQLDSGGFDKSPKIKSMAETLLFQKGTPYIRCEELKQRLIDPDNKVETEKVVKKAEAKIKEIEEFVAKKGGKDDWVISDLPKKEIGFVQSESKIVKNNAPANVLLERDPVKISYDDGSVKLLAQVENSIMSHLQKRVNYIPNVFCSFGAEKLLIEEGIIPDPY